MKFTITLPTQMAILLAIGHAALAGASPIAPKDGQGADPAPAPAGPPASSGAPDPMPSTASIAAMPTTSALPPVASSPASAPGANESGNGAAKDVPPRSYLKPDKLPIVPEPTEYTLGNTPICLSPEFTITFEGKLDESSDLAAACERTRGRVLRETHRYLSIERGLEFWTDSSANRDGQAASDGKADAAAAKDRKVKPCEHTVTELRLSLTDFLTTGHEEGPTNEQRQTIMGGATVPAKSRPALEKYELEIPLDGEATLKGASALGLFRGLATFEQLFYRLEEGDAPVTGKGADGAGAKQTPAPASQPEESDKKDKDKDTAATTPTPASTTRAQPQASGGDMGGDAGKKDSLPAANRSSPADKPNDSGKNTGGVDAHEDHDQNPAPPSPTAQGSLTGIADGIEEDCDDSAASQDAFKVKPIPSIKADGNKAEGASDGAAGDDEDCDDKEFSEKSAYDNNPLPPSGGADTGDEDCKDDAASPTDPKAGANGGPLAGGDAKDGAGDDCEEEGDHGLKKGSNSNEKGQHSTPTKAPTTTTTIPKTTTTAGVGASIPDDCKDEHTRGLHWSTKRADEAKPADDEGKGKGKGGRIYAPFGPYKITDQPAFGWRGLMLDTSRNYFSPDVMKKLFDTMSLVKMNQFHWHITDSNSWPLDLSAFPELAAAAAYSSTERFDEKTVQELVQYAGERGIDVMIEIDMPGHTASLALSHPEHIACFGKAWDTYALQPPAGQLRYANEDTTAWASKIVGELVKSVKGPYMGTGGDELNKRCMEEDEQTQEALQKRGMTLDTALNDFVGKVQEPIWKAKKTPVVWQEMALDHGPMESMSNPKEGAEMPIVQVWKTSADTRAVLDKGYNLVHSPSDYFYLDCGHGGWVASKNGTNSWCDPFKTWHKILSFDPYANLTSEQITSGRVYGGQVALWAEQTDEQTLDGILWPRAAALAELFWGGDRGGKEMYPRDARKWMASMHDVRYRMVERGVRANILQPHWCALRPGMCEV